MVYIFLYIFLVVVINGVFCLNKFVIISCMNVLWLVVIVVGSIVVVCVVLKMLVIVCVCFVVLVD